MASNKGKKQEETKEETPQVESQAEETNVKELAIAHAQAEYEQFLAAIQATDSDILKEFWDTFGQDKPKEHGIDLLLMIAQKHPDPVQFLSDVLKNANHIKLAHDSIPFLVTGGMVTSSANMAKIKDIEKERDALFAKYKALMSDDPDMLAQTLEAVGKGFTARIAELQKDSSDNSKALSLYFSDLHILQTKGRAKAGNSDSRVADDYTEKAHQLVFLSTAGKDSNIWVIAHSTLVKDAKDTGKNVYYGLPMKEKELKFNREKGSYAGIETFIAKNVSTGLTPTGSMIKLELGDSFSPSKFNRTIIKEQRNLSSLPSANGYDSNLSILPIESLPNSIKELLNQ